MASFRNFIKGDQGISLVEMVIGLALVGAAGAGMSSLLKGMGGSEGKAKEVIERSEFASALGVFLNSANGCGALKAGPAIPDTESNYMIQDWVFDGKPRSWNFDGFKNFKTDFPLRYNYIKSLTAVRVDVPGALPLKVLEGGVEKTLKKSLLKFKLVLTDMPPTRILAEMPAKSDKLPQSRYEYNLPVLVDNGTNKIEICSDNTTLAEACFTLNGLFDNDTGKCELPQTCEFFGTYQKATCSPKGYQTCSSSGKSSHFSDVINPVTNGVSCPLGSIALSTGGDEWHTTVDCGKKCKMRVNHGRGYYSCLKCPDP